MLAIVAVRAARLVRSGGMGSQRLAAAMVGVAVVGAALALREDLRIYRFQREHNVATVAYYSLARRMSADAPGDDPVVVGDVPYFFNLATDRRALSIPWSTDDELRDYMTRYGSRHVLLTGDEQKYWRPSWTSDAAVPAFLRIVARDSSATLYEFTSAAPPIVSARHPPHARIAKD